MLRYLLLLAIAVAAAVEGPGLMQSLMQERSSEVAAIRAETPPETYGGGRRVMLEAGPGGHYATRARINNRWVDVMVDTGATTVAIPYEEAVRLGMRPGNSDFTLETRTANGIRYSAPVRLDEVRIGDIILHDVDGLVSPRGALSVTLLGMSFLGRLGGVEMRDGRLVMTQ
ncbi:TIGR02281 family clan AA aspartic protease [Breoghania sp. L-A4]|uniref:retropepsin-like aspartic protease family protein n=1 Tax=Breoghania sp. L-A4 TaxID=2304600 RepID=UPI000E35F52B|nr:TIGR02281 family clan AA aspartic protease [Breoghania sp. L-A4]AXS38902.1 TIGR02281 family clan AA aspartic protease [Breoghania sp. L-A4]